MTHGVVPQQVSELRGSGCRPVELRAILAAQDIPVTGLTGGIYADELFTEARGEATLFLPCGRDPPRGTRQVCDRSESRAGDNHARRPPPESREYYLTDLADTPDQEQWRTRIGWPIFEIAP